LNILQSHSEEIEGWKVTHNHTDSNFGQRAWQPCS